MASRPVLRLASGPLGQLVVYGSVCELFAGEIACPMRDEASRVPRQEKGNAGGRCAESTK